MYIVHWITGASLVFKTEKVASIAVLAMVLGDVAVLHTWNPGVGQRRGWWGVSIQVEVVK